MEKSLDILMRGLIDYAGLFPPASLDMPGAVREYAACRRSPEAPWLGRFVVPAARLDELARAVAAPPGEPPAGPPGEPPAKRAAPPSSPDPGGTWRLSVLVGPDREAGFRAIREFNRAGPGLRPQPLLIDALEMKAETAAEAVAALAGAPAGVTAYVEIPIHGGPPGPADPSDPRDAPGPAHLADLLGAIGRAGGRAKVRTGGTAGELIPPPEAVARFLAACARARVPFKATAGLHHPVRSVRPLTYAPDSPQARMHGFLNVFLAAAFAADGMDAPALAALLSEEDPSAFRFRADAAEWRGRVLPVARLAAARRDFAIAFGSCSFAEPRADLSEEGWL